MSKYPPPGGSLGVHGAHRLDVGAGDEGALSGSCQHDRPDLVVVPQVGEPVAQLRERRHVEGIHRVRAIDVDRRDGAVLLDADHAGTRARRKSTI